MNTPRSKLRGNPLREIIQRLKVDYDKQLTEGGIRHPISALIKEDKITFEETKAGHVYRVVEEENKVIPQQLFAIKEILRLPFDKLRVAQDDPEL